MNTSIKELSADEIDAVSGGFFFGCFSWSSWCAPKPTYSYCQPKPSYCEPKPSYCEPKPVCQPKPSCGGDNGNGGGSSEEM